MTKPAAFQYGNLEPLYKQKAINELREKPDRILPNIISLRRWLNQSPHIVNCPTDDAFLLRFLRVAKYDQEKAQRALENFCTIRGSTDRGMPARFVFPPVDGSDQDLEKYLKMGVHVPLGYNANGEFVLLIRFSAWKIEELSYDRLLHFTFMTMDTMFADERTQIAGVSAIIDLGDVSKKQNEAMSNMKCIRDAIRIWQEGYVMRNRSIFYYRESPLFAFAFELLKFWMNPKLFNRIHRIKHDINKVLTKMPGAKQILPSELGGENGTYEDCRQRWEDKFREHWSKPNPLKDIEIDESKRPMDTLAFLRNYEDYKDTDLFGTKGVYTPIDAL